MAARSQGGTPGKLYDLGRYEEAETTFGKEDALTALVKLLMANGAARVLAVPVEEEADYPAAFALLGEQESVKVVVCDSQTLSVQQALRDQVLADAQVRRERIAVVPGGAEDSVSQLVARGYRKRQAVRWWRRRWPGPSVERETPPFPWAAWSCGGFPAWRSAMGRVNWTRCSRGV